mgnify:CR=1 FL=1
MSSIDEPRESMPFDVLIVGGGPAGHDADGARHRPSPDRLAAAPAVAGGGAPGAGHRSQRGDHGLTHHRTLAGRGGGGTASAGSGTDGCGRADFTSPDGVPGIDNAFARLRPALDLTEASALELIIQEAINSGGLLATVQLDGLHHPTDDACAMSSP